MKDFSRREASLNKLAPYIVWKDEFLSLEDFELIIGESLQEQIKINLDKEGHVLLAGSAGIGKTVAIKLLFYQTASKGAKNYLVNLNEINEYGKIYEEYGEFVTSKKQVLELLEKIEVENAIRKRIFTKVGVSDIKTYNRWAEDNKEEMLCRICVFINELTELYYDEKASKEEQEVTEKTLEKLTRLTKLTGNTGINFIISTLKPGHENLSYQLKNNLIIRLCGRTPEKEISKYILGSFEATKIPSISGRFLLKKQELFKEIQVYDFSEKKYLKRKCNPIGKMLVIKNSFRYN